MKRTALVFLVVIIQACSVCSFASGVAYRKQVILHTPVHVVYVDLNNSNVKVTVAMPKAGRGSSETAASIISRTNPKAAITGTFFDTKSLLPTGDIVIGGVRAHSGCVGPALCITADNKAQIIPQKYRDRKQMADFETVLAGGPTLVYSGKVSLNPKAEGFKDPSLFRDTQRTAVGITALNKLLFVSVNRSISLNKLAKIMLELGAVQAMSLDGGSSTTLYSDGKFMSSTSRKLTNLLLAYETREAYHQASGQLAPTLISSKQVIACGSQPKQYKPQVKSWSDILIESSKKRFDILEEDNKYPDIMCLSSIR